MIFCRFLPIVESKICHFVSRANIFRLVSHCDIFFICNNVKCLVKNKNRKAMSMNCEKCKNKKATVFYADDGGGQHALCPACAEELGKISHYSKANSPETLQPLPFIPSSSLFSLSEQSRNMLPIYAAEADGGERKCHFCSTSISLVRRTGRVGCPECYSLFDELLFPSILTVDSAIGARMPARRRTAIERRRNIAALKLKIKLAVEAENYELAATLRDEIKKLEIHT